MNRNLMTDLVNTLKSLFTRRDKKLVPVKVYAPNNRLRIK